MSFILKNTFNRPIILLQSPNPSEGGIPIVIGLLLWVAIIIGAFFLLKNNKMSQKKAIILLFISFVVGGLIFGANPNPVAPFLEITKGLSANIPINQRIKNILPMVLILGVLLISGYFIGRIFCGYACPLGAIQELMSKFRFKTEAKRDKKPKKVKSKRKKRRIFRWAVFIVYIFGVLFVGTKFAINSNPFLGFQAIKTQNLSLLRIPFILFMIILGTSIFVYRPYCRYFCPYGAVAAQFNKDSKNTIRLGDACKDCGLCDRTCPTDSLDPSTDKSECYYCGRCIDICQKNNSKADQDLLDTQKVADIKQNLTAARLFPKKLDNGEFSEKILKSIIASVPHSAKKVYFKEIKAMINGKTPLSLVYLKDIVEDLCAISGKALKSLKFADIETWIENNETCWKQEYNNASEIIKIADKIFYGTSLKSKNKNKITKNKITNGEV